MIGQSNCNFKLLPKVELHAHLNGSISLKTIRELLEKQSDRPEEYVLQQPVNMEDFFLLFPLIQELTQKPEALRKATHDVIEEFAEDNVIYLELRTTPKNTPFTNKKQYVEIVLEAIEKSNERLKMLTTLILSIDRKQSVEEAAETVDLAISIDSELIVGVELSGDPKIDGRKMIPELQRARDAGLGVAVHLAEMSQYLEEVPEFLDFRPDRIEICLTSNEMCKTTKSADESHLMYWIESGVPVALCTDDKSVMGCDSSGEYEKAYKALSKRVEEPFQLLRKITTDALKHSFIRKKSNTGKYEKLLASLDFLPL
ncbi:unnamed protein product [Caenorhabditis auriculariae]|uniref:Adenosine deaminase domain-containing protein n=1 Tax=Caenorhabditis auriculariae TaxID=2777116 RepID=A0A8S1H9P7_9PELO|nr:unnamed protein product [Caenorhabditis auriculariae]